MHDGKNVVGNTLKAVGLQRNVLQTRAKKGSWALRIALATAIHSEVELLVKVPDKLLGQGFEATVVGWNPNRPDDGNPLLHRFHLLIYENRVLKMVSFALRCPLAGTQIQPRLNNLFIPSEP